MHPRLTTSCLLAACIAAALAACSSGDDSSTPALSTPASASASSAQRACQQIVSLIGFADAWLLPPGDEGKQVFDEAARGAVAEVVGTAERSGDQLPAALRAAADRLVADGHKLVPANAPHETQVESLRGYRAAAQEIVAGCAPVTG